MFLKKKTCMISWSSLKRLLGNCLRQKLHDVCWCPHLLISSPNATPIKLHQVRVMLSNAATRHLLYLVSRCASSLQIESFKTHCWSVHIVQIGPLFLGAYIYLSLNVLYNWFLKWYTFKQRWGHCPNVLDINYAFAFTRKMAHTPGALITPWEKEKGLSHLFTSIIPFSFS